MHFKKLIALSLLGLTLSSTHTFANFTSSDLVKERNVQEVVLPTLENLRKLMALKKYDEVSKQLSDMLSISELNMKENGIFLEIQAELDYKLTTNTYNEVVDVITTANSEDILSKLKSSKLLDRINNTLTNIKKAQDVLDVDKNKFLTQLELEQHPDKDITKIKNDNLVLKPDVIAIKMLESKLHKIELLQNELSVMHKSMIGLKTAVTPLYSVYEKKVDQEHSERNKKIALGVALSLFLSGTTVGVVWLGNKKRKEYQEKKLREARAKAMYELLEKIDELFLKYRNHPNLNKEVINNFKEKVQHSVSIEDIQKLYQPITEYFNML